jgi:flagellar secretion chaperone FliS
MKLNTNHTIYKTMDVSCSETQLVLLLLDAAIRFTKEAAEHLRAGRWAEKGKAVDATMECLAELRKGLNMVEGGEAAANVDRMYDFLTTKLLMGNARSQPDQFDQVVASLESLRTSWHELFERLRSEGRLKEEALTT